jgi:hypothetical protein
MTDPVAPRPLAAGVASLARAAHAARKGGPARAKSPAGAGFLLSTPPTSLATDEILIAVADASSVVLRRVKVPGPAAEATARPSATRVAGIARRIAEIELIASELAAIALSPTSPPVALTDAEERMLRDGGLSPAPVGAREALGLHRTTAEYARLLHDSYTVERAARRLGVNASRIRQRLMGGRRTLLGIKVGKSWRIPAFQFQGRRLVPGIDRVVARLSPDLHPVAVHRWFTSPTPDLTHGDDTPVSPLDWLRAGYPPEAAARLAADL